MVRAMRWLFLLASIGCSSTTPMMMTNNDAGTPPIDAGPKSIAETKFGDFEAWASPIDDYLAVGKKSYPNKFDSSINDLAPFGDKMFFGYGDATYNLGEKIPIEFRSFSSSDDPTAKASVVDGAGQGAPQTTPQQSGEEQIDRYRVLDGALWQAGVDSIDADELDTQTKTMPNKAIDGNVYRLEGEVWKKFRSVRGGEHVHDVMSFKGAVYAVGSGADLRTEFEAGQIFRYLWRTSDLGKTFTTVQRVMHPDPGKGDIRWISLLPNKDTLYLFGYQSDFASNTAKISNSSYDGAMVTDLPMGHPLHDFYATSTLVLPAGDAIISGVDVSISKYATAHVTLDGKVEKLASIEGARVVDTFLADKEIVYLVTAGNDPSAKLTSWDARVLVANATSPDQTKELLAFTSNVRPASIAFYKGHLFLGTGDGHVLRTP